VGKKTFKNQPEKKSLYYSGPQGLRLERGKKNIAGSDFLHNYKAEKKI